MPWQKRAEHVEQAMATEVATAKGDVFDPQRFIPYVQLHEFEAILFAEPLEITAVITQRTKRTSAAKVRSKFQSVLRSAAGHPEAINDRRDHCPSHQTLRIAETQSVTGRRPAYLKGTDGPLIAARIGIDAIRSKCAHFNR
ncbi:MAG: DUF4276 family protein [Planctomycetota bacterium]